LPFSVVGCGVGVPVGGAGVSVVGGAGASVVVGVGTSVVVGVGVGVGVSVVVGVTVVVGVSVVVGVGVSVVVVGVGVSCVVVVARTDTMFSAALQPASQSSESVVLRPLGAFTRHTLSILGDVWPDALNWFLIPQS